MAQWGCTIWYNCWYIQFNCPLCLLVTVTWQSSPASPVLFYNPSSLCAALFPVLNFPQCLFSSTPLFLLLARHLWLPVHWIRRKESRKELFSVQRRYNLGWYNLKWYNMGWYNLRQYLWNGTIWDGAFWDSTSGIVQFGIVQSETVHLGMVHSGMVESRMVQYGMVQSKTVHLEWYNMGWLT